MATLAAGDVTTQLTLYLNANAQGNELNKRHKTALETSTTRPATREYQELLTAWLGR